MPEHTHFIMFAGQKVGFYAATPSSEGVRLEHLYIDPHFQNRGIGGVVLQRILQEADKKGVAVFVGALKESASNRFYRRHGFTKTSETEWDVYYVRLSSKPQSNR